MTIIHTIMYSCPMEHRGQELALGGKLQKVFTVRQYYEGRTMSQSKSTLWLIFKLFGYFGIAICLLFGAVFSVSRSFLAAILNFLEGIANFVASFWRLF